VNNYLSFLQLRPKYRSLWLAQVISLTGDWFNTIASVIIVNRYSASGLAVGSLFIARALPPFLLGPIAGVVADRFDRRKVLILSDMLRAGIVLCFLLVDRPERLWLLYVLTVLQFSVSTFFEPARAARAQSYVEAGADCIYPIGPGDRETLSQLRARITAPINVFASPKALALTDLHQLGINRVSFGPQVFRSCLSNLLTLQRN
jgi:phosphoenolpyruvate phosphomutase-like protein/transmembrane secretion effector